MNMGLLSQQHLLRHLAGSDASHNFRVRRPQRLQLLLHQLQLIPALLDDLLDDLLGPFLPSINRWRPVVKLVYVWWFWVACVFAHVEVEVQHGVGGVCVCVVESNHDRSTVLEMLEELLAAEPGRKGKLVESAVSDQHKSTKPYC